MTARTAAALLLSFSGVAIVAASVGVTLFVLANPQWIDGQLVDAGATRDQLDLIRGPLLTEVVVASGAVGAIEGLLSIGLGWFVFRGRRWAIGTSIAMTSLRLLLIGLCVLVILAGVALGQPSGGVVNAIFTFAIAGVLIANLVLLFVAGRRLAPSPPYPGERAGVRG